MCRSSGKSAGAFSFFFFRPSSPVALSFCCLSWWWKLQAVLHSPSVSGQRPVKHTADTLACSAHHHSRAIINLFCFFLLLSLILSPTHRPISTNPEVHGTQFFIKAGPDHWEESTRHVCPTNSSKTCLCSLGSLPFPFTSNLLYLWFPVNFSIVGIVTFAFLQKPISLSFFYC